MRNGNPVEVWNSFGEEGVAMLLNLLKKISEQEKMPDQLQRYQDAISCQLTEG